MKSGETGGFAGAFAGEIYAKSDNLLIHTAIFPTEKKGLHLITNIYALKEA